MKPLTKLVTGVAAAAAGSYATYVAGTWLSYGHVKQSTDPLLDRFRCYWSSPAGR